MSKEHALRFIQQRFFNQPVDPTMENLFIIALQSNTSDFTELLDDLLNCSDQERILKRTFPGIEKDVLAMDGWDGESLGQALVETNRIGFVCEIHIPECDYFSFHKGGEEDGKPKSWQVHGGVCRVEYCYGDTLDALMDAIEARVTEVFGEYVQKAKKKQTA